MTVVKGIPPYTEPGDSGEMAVNPEVPSNRGVDTSWDGFDNQNGTGHVVSPRVNEPGIAGWNGSMPDGSDNRGSVAIFDEESGAERRIGNALVPVRNVVSKLGGVGVNLVGAATQRTVAVSKRTGQVVGTSIKGWSALPAVVGGAKELRSLKSGRYQAQLWAQEAQVFDSEVLPGILQDGLRLSNEGDERATTEVARDMLNRLRADDVVSSTLVGRSPLHRGFARYIDAERADEAARILGLDMTNLAELTPVHQEERTALVEAERHQPEGRRLMVSLLVAGMRRRIVDVSSDVNVEAHYAMRDYLKKMAESIVETANESAQKLYYRGYEGDVADFERSSFEELSTVLGLSQGKDRTELPNAEGTTNFLLIDRYRLGLDDSGRPVMTPDERAKGFRSLINPEFAQIHNLVPGVSVFGYVKRPEHTIGATAFVAHYDSDRIIQDELGLVGEIMTRVRPMALTSEGATVAGQVSNETWRKQRGLDPTLNPHEVTGKSRLFATALAVLEAQRYAKDFVRKTYDAHATLPAHPNDHADNQTMRRFTTLLNEQLASERQEQAGYVTEPIELQAQNE